MVENDTGRRWLYIKDARIQMRSLEAGDNTLIVVAFRTDGYHRVQGGIVPMDQWLRDNYHFTASLDVPENIVDYALQSVRDREEVVGEIEEILSSALESKEVPRSIEEFKALFQDRDGVEVDEEKIARRIEALMTEAGGLQ